MGAANGLARRPRDCATRPHFFMAVLPRIEFGAYPQMPYEAVSEDVFKEHVS